MPARGLADRATPGVRRPRSVGRLARAAAQRRLGGSCLRSGVTLAPGRTRVRPVITMRLAAVEALADDAVAVDLAADPDLAGADRVVVRDHVDDALVLVGRDRLVGDQHALVGLRGRHARRCRRGPA